MTAITNNTTVGLRPSSSSIAVMDTNADNDRHAMNRIGEPRCERFNARAHETAVAEADTGITCVRCLVLLIAENEIDPDDVVGYLEEICR